MIRRKVNVFSFLNFVQVVGAGPPSLVMFVQILTCFPSLDPSRSPVPVVTALVIGSEIVGTFATILESLQ